MSRQYVLRTNFPTEFQRRCIEFIGKIVPAASYRFFVIDPHMHLKGFVGGNMNIDIERDYQEKHAATDPMHPQNFEKTEVRVVCSHKLMTADAWADSRFYKEFFKPRGYMHDADMFFRRDGKIIAVLTILRNSEMPEFEDRELEFLESAQPLLEYMLNEVYKPARIDERRHLREKYFLTSRELDVLEAALSGQSNKETAAGLKLGMPTVRTHLQHIYDKVGVHSTNELLATIFQQLQ